MYREGTHPAPRGQKLLRVGLPQTSPETPLPLAVHPCPYAVINSWTEVSTSRGSASWSQVSVSRVRLLATPWTAARQASLSIIHSRSLLKLMSTESVMPSSHLILCHPLLPLHKPAGVRIQLNCRTPSGRLMPDVFCVRERRHRGCGFGGGQSLPWVSRQQTSSKGLLTATSSVAFDRQGHSEAMR